MQTTHAITQNHLYGSFKNTQTLSVRRRLGMPGAYVRLAVKKIGTAPVMEQLIKWEYHNNFDDLRQYAKATNQNLFNVLLRKAA
jgi:hypothetical protein